MIEQFHPEEESLPVLPDPNPDPVAEAKVLYAAFLRRRAAFAHLPNRVQLTEEEAIELYTAMRSLPHEDMIRTWLMHRLTDAQRNKLAVLILERMVSDQKLEERRNPQ